jgi:hypothetical protein
LIVVTDVDRSAEKLESSPPTKNELVGLPEQFQKRKEMPGKITAPKLIETFQVWNWKLSFP